MKYRLGTTLGVLSQLSAVGLLLTSGWLISRAAEQPPVLYLMVAIVSVRFFGVSRSVLRYAERLATHNAVLGDLSDERIDLYRALERSAPLGLTNQRRGDVLRRIVADVDALQDRIVRVRQPWIETVVTSYLTVAVVALIEPIIGLVLGIVVSVAAFVVPFLVDLATAKTVATIAPVHGVMSATMVEALSIAPEAVVYGQSQTYVRQVENSVTSLAHAESRNASFAGIGSALVALLIGVAVVFSAVLAVGLVGEGNLAPVLIAVVVLAPLALWDSLDQLSTVAQLRRQTASSMERIAALKALPPTITEPDNRVEIPEDLDIDIRGLVVGWAGNPVTQPIQASIPFGSIVAVTSPSGGGKSTFAATLARLIEPISGQLNIGGLDIRDFESAQIRSLVTVLEQEGHLFDTSIRENMRIGDPEASDSTIHAALVEAGLGEFIHSLPKGLATMVGSAGNQLSGGERQRLALARALLAGRQILILDEPTEFLDAPTAQALLSDVLKLRGRHSVIILTHNPEVVAQADVVLALEPFRLP